MQHTLLAALPPSVLICFFNFHSNMMRYPLLAALPAPLVLVSSSNPHSNMMQYPLLAALPPPPALHSFLIKFLLKYDAVSSYG